MILGTAVGLYSYFEIGFYVAALLGALVSMVSVILSTVVWPQEYDWENLRNGQAVKGVRP